MFIMGVFLKFYICPDKLPFGGFREPLDSILPPISKYLWTSNCLLLWDFFFLWCCRSFIMCRRHTTGEIVVRRDFYTTTAKIPLSIVTCRLLTTHNELLQGVFKVLRTWHFLNRGVLTFHCEQIVNLNIHYNQGCPFKKTSPQGWR